MIVLDSIVDGVLDMALYDEAAAGSLIIAILRYMRTGEEPSDLEDHVRSAWIMLLPVIKRSKARADSGRKGGKASAKQTASKREANDKHKTDFASPFASLSSSSSYLSIEEGVQGEGTEPFTPPTEDECRDYFGANFLRGDPDTFHAYYAAQGWRRSNGMPVEDWHALAKLWNNRQASIDAERAARGEPTPDEARWRPTVNADPDADPRADAERAQEEYERAKARLTPEERRQLLLE